MQRKMRSFALLTALLALDAASGFLAKHSQLAYGEFEETTTTGPLIQRGDDNFEGLNLKNCSLPNN
jgi:hypothetical protein